MSILIAMIMVDVPVSINSVPSNIILLEIYWTTVIHATQENWNSPIDLFRKNPQKRWRQINNVDKPRKKKHLQLQVLGLLVFPRCMVQGLELEVLHVLLEQSDQHSGSGRGHGHTHNLQPHGYRSQQSTDKQPHPQAINRRPAEDSNETEVIK